ncbi:RNA polymerase [Virgisporangium aurantiacum]|uniref:RNA polymerase n=1 Tax=Virgisporangium aurantiacum TaxID=175570 RepID=A0A8J3ZD62_9ACTN|nr:RNA polymerase [Virgisporangium aurantiacum]
MPVTTAVDAAFEAYVEARGAALVRFAVVLTGDDHRAEDIVQDVLAKAYLKWNRIVRVELPDVYIRRMVINASRSWWRRPTNRETPVERSPEPAAGGDLSTRIAERDSMWRLITTLSARQRAVLALRYYEDLDDDTIASILHCSPVTVRVHALRALTALRERFAAGLPSGEEQ